MTLSKMLDRWLDNTIFWSFDRSNMKQKFVVMALILMVLSGGIMYVIVSSYQVREKVHTEPFPVIKEKVWPTANIVATSNYTYRAMVSSFLLEKAESIQSNEENLFRCLHAAYYFDPAPNLLLVYANQDWHILKDASYETIGDIVPTPCYSATDKTVMHICNASPQLRVYFDGPSVSVKKFRYVSSLESPWNILQDPDMAKCIQIMRKLQKTS